MRAILEPTRKLKTWDQIEASGPGHRNFVRLDLFGLDSSSGLEIQSEKNWIWAGPQWDVVLVTGSVGTTTGFRSGLTGGPWSTVERH